MGTGYTRNDTGNNIADGNVINASDLDGEFDAIQAAFNESTGHTHDGTSAEGAPITKLGPSQNVDVGTGAITPSLDNTVDLGSGSLEFKDLYIDGTANIDSLVADTADINAGTIDGTTIGGSTPAAATVTTLTVNGNTTLGDAATDTVTFTADVASNVIPSVDNTYDLGASGSEWKDLYIDGTANIDSLVADTADINGGTIDGVTIGGAAAGVGTFTTANATTVDTTNIEVTNIKAKDGSAAATIADSTGVITVGSSVLTTTDINGGTIDGTTIGGASAAAGTFTTATATTGNITTVNATTVDTTNLEVTTLKAKDGTSAGSIADSTGVVTLASSVLTTTDINGGTIDGATIGGASAAAGSFTTLNTSGAVVFNDAGADVDFRVEGDTNANLLFVDASTDRVGIGTSSPGAKLEVAVAGFDGINIKASTTNQDPILTLTSPSTNYWNMQLDASVGDSLQWRYNNSEKMVVTSAGSVGIGTTSPIYDLQVGTYGTDADSSLALASSTSGTGTIRFGDGTSGPDANRGLIQYDHSANAMSFNTNANPRMTIDSSGNVLIGTTTASAKLYVEASSGGLFKAYTAGVAQISIGHTGGSLNYYDGDEQIFRSGAGTERGRFTSGGYFKATSDGNYYGVVGNYHEFNQHNNSDCVLMDSGNASLTNPVLSQLTTRAASSAFTFFRAYSGSGSDTEFILRGDGNAYADGSWNGSGADYAEYFESAGETIARGTTVVLDNNKVRAATENDPASSIIGVVRPKEFGKGSMVVGNLAWNMWANKYLTDDFGVYEMEDHDVLEWEEQVLETEATEAVVDEEGNEVSPAQEAVYKTVNHSYESHAVPEGVTVPADATRKTHDENGKKFQHRKLNPAWSAEVEYTPREERPEWHIVGLLGQVPVLKGQPVGDRWIKMRDISETVEEWFIR